MKKTTTIILILVGCLLSGNALSENIWATSKAGSKYICAATIDYIRERNTYRSFNNKPSCSNSGDPVFVKAPVTELGGYWKCSWEKPKHLLSEIQGAQCKSDEDDISYYHYIKWNKYNNLIGGGEGNNLKFRSAEALSTKIKRPLDKSDYLTGSKILFSATGNGNGLIDLKWTSSIDGEIGKGVSFSKSNLSKGTHKITLVSRLSDHTLIGCCKATKDSHTIKVFDRPTVTIVQSDSSYAYGSSSRLLASPRGGDGSGRFKWHSNKDGELGNLYALPISSLSVNKHIITVSYTSGGYTVTDSVNVTIKKASEVTINSPIDGASFLHNEKIFFSSNSVFDGVLTDTIWSSSLDGQIGQGDSINISTLSAGIHTITAKSTPALGSEFSSTSTITVDISEEKEDENLADEEMCEGQSFGGNPINLQTGNKIQREVDYTSDGSFPLIISRVYNSKSNSKGLFGPNWASNFEQRIEFDDLSKVAIVRKMSGAVERFHMQDGNWVSSRPSQVSKNSLEKRGAEWLYKLKNGSVEIYDAQGRISKITSVNGYSQSYQYTGSSLTSISDDLDRKLAITYDGDFIETITTPDGNVYKYDYELSLNGSEFNLTSITYPSINVDDAQVAGVKTYLYNNASFPHALTGITGETNQRFATWKYDARGRAIYSGHGDGSKNGNGFEDLNIEYIDSTKTVTKNAFGKETTYHYEAIDGILKTTLIEGEPALNCGAASQGTHYYSDSGWVKDKIDPNGNITAYTYNKRGLISTVKVYGAKLLNPSGLYTGVVPDYFDGDYSDLDPDHQESITWHPTLPKKDIVTKPGLIIDYDYYDNGLLKNVTQKSTKPIQAEDGIQTDFADRTWSYKYTFHTGKRIATKTIDGPRTDVDDITLESYDGVGNLVSTKNAKGHIVTIINKKPGFGHDGVIDENNIKTNFKYNNRGWLESKEITHNENKWDETYKYYPNGLLKEKHNANGSYEKYKYNSAKFLTEIENSKGEKYKITPDEFGSWLSKSIYAADGELKFNKARQPDALGRTLSITGADGQFSQFKYDNNGNVKLHTISLENDHELRIEKEYDWNNRIISESPTSTAHEPRVNTYYQYEFGRLVSVEVKPFIRHSQPAKLTRYIYNGFGDLLKEDSPNRGSTYFHYDLNASLMTKLTDARGIAEIRQYDILNRLFNKKYSDPNQNQKFIYDQIKNGSLGVGKLGQIIDSSGSTSYEYDFLSNITKHDYSIGGNQYQIIYAYNNAGDLSNLTYPSGREIELITDSMGKISQINDSSEILARDIKYMPYGPVKHINYGNGLKESFDYDKSYRMTKNGQWAEYKYNKANQVTYALGKMAHAGGINFVYDNQGRVKAANWPISKKDPANDSTSQDNLIHTPENSTGDITSLDYAYDDFGNLNLRSFNGYEMQTYPVVKNNRATGLNTWARQSSEIKIEENSDRLMSLTTQDFRLASKNWASPNLTLPGIQTHYGYDSTGNLTSRKQYAMGYPNKGVNSGFRSEELKYNDQGRLTKIFHDEGLVSEYLYNAKGQRVNSRVNGVSTDYHYDLSGQLLAETNKDGEVIKEYVYLNGAPLALIDSSIKDNGIKWLDDSGSTIDPSKNSQIESGVDVETSYNTALYKDGDIILNLKNNGKATQAGITEVGFSLVDASFSNIPVISIKNSAKLQYVPIPMADISVPLPMKLNQRIEFSTQDNSVVTITNSYDWIKLSRTGNRFTLFGRDNITSNWTSLASVDINVSDELTVKASALNATMQLAQMSVSESADPTFFMHNDHLSTTRIMTDKYASLVWKNDLGPFGETFKPEFQVASLTPDNIDNNQRFPGQYANSETGYSYNYFRDYDPQTARYIQSDPIGLAGGLNTYAYANSNPIMYIDPLGLEAWVNASPNGNGGYNFTAHDNQGSTLITGSFNNNTTNFNQIRPGTYNVTPRPTLPNTLSNWLFDRNANAGNPTISNTNDWNTIQYSNGDITTGAQFHEGRNGSSSGVSQACMVSDRPTNNALNQMFQRNYNNGGVTLTVYPPGFQGI